MWAQIPAMAIAVGFDSTVHHPVVLFGDPEIATGQLMCGAIMVATEAPSQGVDNTIQEKDDSSQPHTLVGSVVSIQKKLMSM